MAGRLSYSRASRVGTSLRTRTNGTTPASGTEAQLGLEATNLEMAHTCEELLSSTYLPTPSAPHTRSHAASLKRASYVRV